MPATWDRSSGGMRTATDGARHPKYTAVNRLLFLLLLRLLLLLLLLVASLQVAADRGALGICSAAGRIRALPVGVKNCSDVVG